MGRDATRCIPCRLAAWFGANLSIGAPMLGIRGFGSASVPFALVMIGLGIRGLVCGDFAGTWQRIPIAHLPWRGFFAHACAVVELLAGIGLLIPRTLKASAATLSVYLLLWVVLLKLPAVLYAPQMEATWLGAGEIAVMLSGAWVLWAEASGKEGRLLTGSKGMRNARLLFVLALPTIGLSHFIYGDITAGFVPGWLPWHYGWAYLTGAGSLAAAFGILFARWPRLAATLEAAMLAVITLLVWLPGIFETPVNDAWTALLISSAIACGAWAVANSYRRVAWLNRDRPG
jgi:uncharacterized membrane protein